MKKVIKYMLLLFGCMTLISCNTSGKKDTLSCTIEQNVKDGIVTKMNVKVDYEAEKIIKAVYTYTLSFDVKKYSDEEINELVTLIAKDYRDNYDLEDKITIDNQKISDNEYNVIVSVDYKNLTAEEKNKYGLDSPDGKEKSKNDFEKAGYTCE